MKRLLFILPIIVMAFVLSGCTAMMSMSAYGTSDLYKTDNRAEVATRLKNEAEVARLEAEARQAQWEARLAEANASAAEAEYYAVVNQQPNYSNVVADDYQSAYARRLYGFQSPTYRMPSSYYNMLNSSSIYYVTAYDPAYYNIMVSGDQVWVEPKYITSMFGSWGATNVTFGIYASPWNYGWSYRVDPFYYSMWGYPHYSWYDWNWNMCYNPFYYDWYWGGYYPHHHHHHHHPVPPPSHRPDNRPGYHPDHTTGSGASVGPGNMNGNRVNTGSRYTSPTSNRNYGATDSRGNSRPTSGSTSQGFNSSSVRPSTGTSKDSRFNVVESNTRVNTSVGAASNSNTTKSSGGNFRQGTSQNSGTRTTISSGSSRVGTSSSSGSSRSSSSSNFRTSSSSSNSSSSFRSSSSSSSSSSSRSSSGSFRSSGSSSGSSSSGSFRSSGSSSGSSRR